MTLALSISESVYWTCSLSVLESIRIVLLSLGSWYKSGEIVTFLNGFGRGWDGKLSVAIVAMIDVFPTPSVKLKNHTIIKEDFLIFRSLTISQEEYSYVLIFL